MIPATTAAALIREHRGAIESRWHWVKDVVQHEDASLIGTARPAPLRLILRNGVADPRYDLIWKMRVCACCPNRFIL